MSTPATLQQTRERLQQLLQGVPGVGNVHVRERYTGSESKFRELYLYTLADPALDAFAGAAHLRGWHIRRIATEEMAVGANLLNTHTWQVRGYLSFNDEFASELIFDDLVERMREAVRWSPSLGLPRLSGGQSQERGAQLVNAGPVYFCGVLCHSAVLQLTTTAHIERPRS